MKSSVTITYSLAAIMGPFYQFYHGAIAYYVQPVLQTRTDYRPQ